MAEHLRAVLAHIAEPPESLTSACSLHVQALLSRQQLAPVLGPHAAVSAPPVLTVLAVTCMRMHMGWSAALCMCPDVSVYRLYERLCTAVARLSTGLLRGLLAECAVVTLNLHAGLARCACCAGIAASGAFRHGSCRPAAQLAC